MNKKKQVLFVVSALRGGGAERSVLKTYQLLEKELECECHIILFENVIEHELPQGTRIHILDEIKAIPKNGLNRFSYRKKAVNIVDEFIDKNFPPETLILSNMVFADKVMSLSKHNVHHIIRNSYTEAMLVGKNFIKKQMVKHNLSKVYGNHPLIFVSKAAQDSFNQSFDAKTPQQVIYNPIDLEFTKNQAIAFDVKSELPDDYIIHVGRFNRQKRHDLLLKAYSESQCPYKLVILGEGKLRPQIEAQIKALKLEDKVILLGFKPNPYPYIKAAKALILTSDFEGLPTVLIEATALEVPIISTNCAGVKEIIGKNERGLVNYQDWQAIADKIASTNEYEQFKSSVPQGVNRFEIANIYQELLSS